MDRTILIVAGVFSKRRDTTAQLLAQLASALHWFNPLVWLAAWRLGVDCERACDDLVLASGVRQSAYAGHLLELVTPLKSRILFHNSGQKAVVFRTREWHQSGGHKARDAKGAEIPVESVDWTRIAWLVPFRLEPGEFVEAEAAGIGVGANKDDGDWQGTRVGAWIGAKAGEVLRSMFMTKLLKVASVGFVLGATASGVEGFAQDGLGGIKPPPRETSKAARADDMATREVKPGKVRFEVIERAYLEPSRAQVFHSEVEGRATIISLRPDGSQVKKGELICELDSSPFKEKLVNQTITAKSAEAAYEKARLAREAAEIALTEYVEGTLKQERLDLKTTFASAQSAVREATVRLERIRDVRKRVKEALAGKGAAATPADMVAELDIEDRLGSAERTLQRKRRALERAKARQEVLEKSTSQKRSAELKGEVEHRRSDELTRLVAWRLEKSMAMALRQQIERCKIDAPFHGYIVLANDPDRKGDDPKIEVSSSVRQRQYLFKLLDLDSPLRLNTKVHESHIELITPGQRARIIVDALPKQKMTGVVQAVAPLPDPTNWFEPRVYSTWVEIDNAFPNLRPGVAAQVEILVPELENVLSVPFKAVLWYDDKHHLAVKKPDGGFEWREVAIAHSDGTIAVIGQGLKSGDVVALDPLALMSEAEKRQKFGPRSNEK